MGRLIKVIVPEGKKLSLDQIVLIESSYSPQATQIQFLEVGPEIANDHNKLFILADLLSNLSFVEDFDVVIAFPQEYIPLLVYLTHNFATEGDQDHYFEKLSILLETQEKSILISGNGWDFSEDDI